MRIAVLMTCHNRRAKTVACLEALSLAAERVPNVAVEVFLTDDGSTDGTAGAVQRLPLPVTVITGTGDLYWNGGMIRAWRAADASGRAFEGYLLLNDDTILDPAGLANLVDSGLLLGSDCIVVGAVADPVTGAITYGGVRRVSSWHPGKLELVEDSDTIQDVDTFNANCVLVPASVRQRIGTLDPTFRHRMGDFDYGLRASESGIRVVVAPGSVGSCARNEDSGSWRAHGLTLMERFRALESPKGIPRREWRVFLRRHGAPFAWLLAWLPSLRAFQLALRR